MPRNRKKQNAPAQARSNTAAKLPPRPVKAAAGYNLKKALGTDPRDLRSHIPVMSKEYMEAVDHPWRKRAVVPHIPLAENGMPCTSNTFPIYGSQEFTILASPANTCLDLFFYPEGLATNEVDSTEFEYGQMTTTTTAVSMGPPSVGETTACAGWAIQSLGPTTNQGLSLPALPTVNDALNYDTSTLNVLPIQRGNSATGCDMARLVYFGVRVGFVGRQVDIEGSLESFCAYEVPGYPGGAAPTFNQFRVDGTYSRQTFSSKRFAEWEWRPNCETPVYRGVSTTSFNSLNYGARMRGRVIDLIAGDKIRVEFCAGFEINRRGATYAQVPAPIASDASMIANSIMTAGKSGGKLTFHHIAHKVLQHPHLRKHGHLIKAALEVIAGTATGSALIAAFRSAASAIPEELLVPLLALAA